VEGGEPPAITQNDPGKSQCLAGHVNRRCGRPRVLRHDKQSEREQQKIFREAALSLQGTHPSLRFYDKYGAFCKGETWAYIQRATPPA
jgi:hypothetical protein